MKLHIAAIGLLLFVSSCRKQADTAFEDNTQKQPVRVENNQLVFRNFSDFSAFLQKMHAMSDAERKQSEIQLGYKSLATLYDEVNARVVPAETPAEVNSALSGYESLFTYTEKGLDYSQNKILAKVVDKSGLFKIGQAQYKALDKGRVIATTKDFELLKSINTVEDYIARGTDDIRIDWFQSKQHFLEKTTQLATEAGPYESGTNRHYLISVRNESNNRRLYTEMIQENTYVPQYIGETYNGFTYTWEMRLEFSHTKKGAFGIWSSYVSPTYVGEIRFYTGYPPAWNLRFSGTLDNGMSKQVYSDASALPWFGTPHPMAIYSAAAAATWTEPIFSTPTRVMCTGNGQNWYFNNYLN